MKSRIRGATQIEVNFVFDDVRGGLAGLPAQGFVFQQLNDPDAHRLEVKIRHGKSAAARRSRQRHRPGRNRSVEAYSSAAASSMIASGKRIRPESTDKRHPQSPDTDKGCIVRRRTLTESVRPSCRRSCNRMCPRSSPGKRPIHTNATFRPLAHPPPHQVGQLHEQVRAFAPIGKPHPHDHRDVLIQAAPAPHLGRRVRVEAHIEPALNQVPPCTTR